MSGPARRPLADRFWEKVDRSAGLFGCWPWTGAYSEKRHFPPRPVIYVAEWTSPEGRRAQLIIPAARLALALHDGVPLDERAGLHACHLCDNPACVRFDHLYWGAREENHLDRYGQRGTRTLTIEDVRVRLGSL